MKNEKFKVLQYIRELIIRIDKELLNFPKKSIEIKQRISSNTYDLLELSYEANVTNTQERKIELLERCMAKLKVIDFLLNLSYDDQLISNKKYLKLAEKIDDIVKYITGWLNKIKATNGA